MKIIKFINTNLDKKTKVAIFAVGLATILSSCSKTNEPSEVSYIPPKTASDTTTYGTINNGYRMKVLTIENEFGIENLVGYFDIGEKVKFVDVVTNSVHNLTKLSNSNRENIYVSDITEYISVEQYVDPKVDYETLKTLENQLNTNSKIQKDKSAYSINYNLLTNIGGEQKSIEISNVTENIKDYQKNDNGKKSVEDISFGK